ncbi:hypothetical protein HN014_22205 (plasmid) [Aquimarina sp. TRL1]|uniref:DUF6876 family protein n=1 Tax=Aquimarina sp. (strain TRL1) TaxID=2736252 RepID=UPI00158B5AFB|nr:DUF6876 family protein [Aquimarina sp. TRL1]QKX07715.1 hypothetical protein HN014_22205 [Aquimarina sp. TRL1]
MKSKQFILNQLASCKNSSNIYYHYLTEAYYTNGIIQLAELCECDWFINEALVICELFKDLVPFITIDFKKTDNNSKVIYSDGAAKELYRKEYNITNFPLDKQRLFFCNNTLQLPNEL